MFILLETDKRLRLSRSNLERAVLGIQRAVR